MSPALFEQIIDHLFELEILDKASTHRISLFNWGEPFLNPEINEILQILKKRKLYVGISSNFIVRPHIDKECLPIISDLTFSLSGFSQDSYDKIHGASLNRVLNNFDNLYAEMCKYSPETHINISWHRYSFNENEFWNAYRYFNRPGIRFGPTIAYLNDLLELLDFLNGRLSERRKKRAEKDLFFDHIHKGVAYCKKKSKNYHCPAWDFLVIDEIGQLLLCCGTTRYDSDHVLGNILEMSAKEIWEGKSTDALCNECLSSGLALWVYSQKPRDDKPWPSGGGLDHLKLSSLYGLRTLRAKPGQMLRRFPNGEKNIRMIKELW